MLTCENVRQGESFDGIFWSGCPVGWCSLTKSNGTLLEVEFAGGVSILDPLLAPINVKVNSELVSPVAVDPKPVFYSAMSFGCRCCVCVCVCVCVY